MPDSAPVARLRVIADPDGNRYHHLQMWCPGCDELHAVTLVGPDGYTPPTCWTWNGSIEMPGVEPSILVRANQWPTEEFPELKTAVRRRARHPDVPVGGTTVCHSFLRAGRWQFLTDSTHDLAGQTVEMVPLPPEL